MTSPLLTPWPFVGRRAEVDHLRGDLGDPAVAGVVVTAPAGAGKTRLAREATDGREPPPLWWRAAAAVTTVPFGALADVLDLDADATPTAAYHRARALVESAGGLVIVDDAPWLDPRSADLLDRLVTAGHAKVLATARAGVEVPPWMEWLWLDERTRHHELLPLGVGDVASLVDHALSEVADEDRRRLAGPLADRSGGNALYLRELLVELRRQRAAGGTLDVGAATPPHLLQVLGTRLQAVGAEVRSALTTVAVLGSAPLGVLEDRCGAAAVAAAEQAGYLVIGDDARRTVRPAHPLHAEAALAQLPESQRRRIAIDVAAAVLADPAAPPQERLVAVAATVDHGGSPSVAHLVDAARSAFAALDHELAARLASAAVAAGDPFEAKVVLGAALSGAGREAQAEEALRDALAAADDDDQRARAAGRLSVHLVAHGRRLDEAAALLDAVGAELVEPTARSFLAADRAKLATIRGEVPTEPLAADPTDELATLNGAIAGAYVAAMAGDAERCRATIATALPLAATHRAVLPWSGELVRFSGTFASLVADGPDAAAREAADELDRAAMATAPTTGTWRFLHGFATAVTGRLGEASASLATAADELAGHDLIGARPLALSAAAWGAAQAGDVARARALLDESVEAAAHDARVRAQVAVADAWCDAHEGAGPGATAKAIRAALDALDGGQVVSAVVVLNEAVRLGAAEAALAPLARVARTAPSSWLVEFVRDRATAEHERDEVALARLARRAAGRWPVAVAELHAARHRLAAARHDDLNAARAAIAARAVAASLGSSLPLTLASVPSPLTERETHVAVAVAAGARNREVADAAGVSVRTVENQLQSIYRKLGIGDRRDLAALLSSGT